MDGLPGGEGPFGPPIFGFEKTGLSGLGEVPLPRGQRPGALRDCFARSALGSNSPAVFQAAFYFYLGSPLPGEGLDGHVPSNMDSLGPVSSRIRGIF